MKYRSGCLAQRSHHVHDDIQVDVRLRPHRPRISDITPRVFGLFCSLRRDPCRVYFGSELFILLWEQKLGQSRPCRAHLRVRALPSVTKHPVDLDDEPVALQPGWRLQSSAGCGATTAMSKP